MLDIDPGKLLIIGIVALVVIPPKDLPSVMRQVGQAIGKLRRMAAEFQSQFMDAVREAELDEIRKNVASIADGVKLDVGFDPVASVRNEIKGALGEGTIGAGPAQTSAAGAAAEPPKIDADEAAAAADIAPLLPAQGDAAAAAVPPPSPQTIATTPAPPLASAEPAVAAQEAGARRS